MEWIEVSKLSRKASTNSLILKKKEERFGQAKNINQEGR